MNNGSFNEQLSALMDGELSRDETRFLMRRLDADTQLATAWSNYQIASDVLKKRYATPLREDFAASVMQAIVIQPAAGRGHWLRWAGGGAIAAAVAVFALTATGPSEDAAPLQPPMVASAATPVTTGPSTTHAEQQLQSGILPGLPMLDYTQAASYDQWMNPTTYPPLIESRAPQVIYYQPVDAKR